jgi:hypothetical protein
MPVVPVIYPHILNRTARGLARVAFVQVLRRVETGTDNEADHGIDFTKNGMRVPEIKANISIGNSAKINLSKNNGNPIYQSIFFYYQ